MKFFHVYTCLWLIVWNNISSLLPTKPLPESLPTMRSELYLKLSFAKVWPFCKPRCVNFIRLPLQQGMCYTFVFALRQWSFVSVLFWDRYQCCHIMHTISVFTSSTRAVTRKWQNQNACTFYSIPTTNTTIMTWLYMPNCFSSLPLYSIISFTVLSSKYKAAIQLYFHDLKNV